MKKQPPQISEEKILDASWALLGEDSIEKFSLRRLADRLGIQAPSLYWYFKSKQHLYQRMGNQVSKAILDELRSEGDWREKLTELGQVTRNVLRRYPCSTQIMMMTLPFEADMVRFTNKMLVYMEETPLSPAHRMQAVLTLVNYVFFFVLDDYQHQRTFMAFSEGQEQQMGEQMANLLDSMQEADAGLFRSLFRSGMFQQNGTDSAFEFGLKLILLGIEQAILEEQAGRL